MNLSDFTSAGFDLQMLHIETNTLTEMDRFTVKSKTACHDTFSKEFYETRWCAWPCGWPMQVGNAPQLRQWLLEKGLTAQEDLSREMKSGLCRAAIGWAVGHCQLTCTGNSVTHHMVLYMLYDNLSIRCTSPITRGSCIWVAYASRTFWWVLSDRPQTVRNIDGWMDWQKLVNQAVKSDRQTTKAPRN